MTWVDTYVSWCFFIAMAAPVVFVVIYITMPWWQTWEGRVIMLKQALWIGFLANGVLYFALGEDWPGRNVLRVVLFTILPIALWGLTILLIVRRRESRALAEAESDAKRARRDAVGAHEDAVEAREDAAGAHEDAVEAREDAAGLHQAKIEDGDTDPELKKVGS